MQQGICRFFNVIPVEQAVRGDVVMFDGDEGLTTGFFMGTQDLGSDRGWGKTD
ncbi:MAG: hypothetical protein ACL7BU_05755 [Candidatus Phlomobacter fragariae]